MARNRKRLKIEKKKVDKNRINAKDSDQFYQDETINPFEIRHNKIKHRVLGRKLAKNEYGKPFLNRNRAYKKREQTLLEEYKYKHKSGKGLQDLREMNAEQRVIDKYRQDMNRIDFNDNQTIKLTHKGKPLEDLINDRLSDDDEDFDLFNRDDYVETTHFGGGNQGPVRSRSEILDEIMAKKSKIKQEKEEMVMLREKLDNEWNEIKNLVRHKGSNQMSNQDKPTPEDYDNLLTQLLFDDQNLVKKEPTLPQSSSSALQDDQCSLQTPDALFKIKLNLIDSSKDVNQIIRLIKEIIEILPKISKKSSIILKNRLVELTKANLKFTPKEMSILTLGAYFQEFQVLIHLVVFKTLMKIRYKTLNEIACAIFLTNFILRTIQTDRFYPELLIHLENLICLCLPTDTTPIKLFHRLEHEVECHLSVSRFSSTNCRDRLKENPKYLATLTNLFGNVFKENDENIETVQISFNLALQVFQLLDIFLKKISSETTKVSIGFMLRPLADRIQTIIQSNDVLPKRMRNVLEELWRKLGTNEPMIKSIIINNVQPKPFVLPLLEPRFDDDYGAKTKVGESKKLLKKYKREFKGAKREIKKDSTFLRDTYLKEMEKKDRIRNKKVKEILKDLSIQQGLYKKSK